MAYPFYPQTYPYQQYFPANYQPVQAAPQQVQQPYNPVANQSGIIWISGLQEAQMYPIAPNNAVALWARDGKTIYLKQADATGKPSIKMYDLVERAETAAESSEKADNKSDEYAKKSDLAAVVGVVKGFDELISSLKSDIDTMKGDMYGIAGKKRPVKKAEVVENDE